MIHVLPTTPGRSCWWLQLHHRLQNLNWDAHQELIQRSCEVKRKKKGHHVFLSCAVFRKIRVDKVLALKKRCNQAQLTLTSLDKVDEYLSTNINTTKTIKRTINEHNDWSRHIKWLDSSLNKSQINFLKNSRIISWPKNQRRTRWYGHLKVRD